MRTDLLTLNGGARAVNLNIPRIGIVITDGKPTQGADSVKVPSDNARTANIILFAIEAGNHIDAVLDDIANEGNYKFSMEDCVKVIDQIRADVCPFNILFR